MRTWRSIIPLTILGLGSSLVASLPTEDNLLEMMASGEIDKRCPFANVPLQEHDDLKKRAGSIRAPIDITGEHAFQPPDFENGDERGPCPGLNALANHGYIPHNGVVSFGHAIAAVNEVYGMGIDLATVLAAAATTWVGNPISVDPSFSIGGISPAATNLLDNAGGLLGEPRGFNGGHNFVEADSSNTRDDLYVSGDNYRLNMDQFMEWYNTATDDTFTMDMMAARSKLRLDQSKQTNPNFYYGPFTGLVARNMAYLANVRQFANHSPENPEGITTKEIIRNFYAIYEEEDKLTYREGWERIPENWYKTPEDWGLAGFGTDLVGWALKYPELANIGGNTGTVNSFTGVYISEITGGVLNASTLLEDNNLLCFVFQILKGFSPNSLSGLYKTMALPLEMIIDALEAPLVDLSCPAFEDMQIGGKSFWEAAQELYPGAMKSGSSF
ncbi:hypothetical protein FQN54_009299 [Arachnomyces sp. PD_36]|nr:hypothetical protein FQN54_009299 [Arachnomyces sp. PD_36]